MNHDQVKAFERGHELTWKGIRTICLYTDLKPAGGVGMGEYPETAIAVFQNGLVVTSDPWSSAEITVVHPSLHDTSTEF